MHTSKIFEELDKIEEESEQKISSAKTSVNIIPRTFKVMEKEFAEGSVNLDYGGGRFDTATDWLAERGVTNYVYDPYNRSSGHNQKVLAAIKANKGADTVTCNNVLNVIAEESARDRVLRNICSLLKADGTAYFCVYKGDGSGEGKETKAGYQNNQPTKFYVSEIQKYFSSVIIKRDVIVAK